MKQCIYCGKWIGFYTVCNCIDGVPFGHQRVVLPPERVELVDEAVEQGREDCPF